MLLLPNKRTKKQDYCLKASYAMPKNHRYYAVNFLLGILWCMGYNYIKDELMQKFPR